MRSVRCNAVWGEKFCVNSAVAKSVRWLLRNGMSLCANLVPFETRYCNFRKNGCNPPRSLKKPSVSSLCDSSRL